MSDKQDSGDEIQTISHKFRSVTTLEPVFKAAAPTPVELMVKPVVKTNHPAAAATAATTTTTTTRATTNISSSTTSSSSSVVSEENNCSVRNLPEINLPEKILLVVDTAREAQYTPFKLGNGTKYSPLFMIRRVIENFVCAKSGIRRGNEFALMRLGTDGAHWMCDFTANTKTIVNRMETMVEEILEEDKKEVQEVEEEEGEEEEEERKKKKKKKKEKEEVVMERERTYDLGQLFEKIEARLPLPSRSHHDLAAAAALPKFVTRVILIYARSDSIPRFRTGRRYLENLTENPYFFLDALFVHEPACAEHACEEVYAGIAALDTTSFSYILEVGRNAAKLHDNMAKLLAHPLQRPPQKDAQYTIFSAASCLLTEVRTNV